MKYPFFTLLVCFFTLASCSTIEKSQRANVEENEIKLVGINDVVLSVERFRDLENIMGNADIFGRRTKEGETVLRFAGVEDDGTVILYRTDIDIMTNETTMSRTPLASTSSRTTGTADSSIYGNQVVTGINLNTNTTTSLPAEDYHIVIPSDAIRIELTKDENFLPMSGYIVEIINATPNSLQYSVSEQ